MRAGPACNDDDIDLRAPDESPDSFTDQPLRPVASNGASNTTGGDDGDPCRMTDRTRPTVQTEQTPTPLVAPSQHGRDVATVAKPRNADCGHGVRPTASPDHDVDAR